MKIDKMNELLKESLHPKRYEHSVNVMHEAVILAQHYNINEKKAMTAGLLHDCGREIANGEAVDYAKSIGIKVGVVEKVQPVLLHAHVGRYIAEKKYGVTDKEILDAISFHTTGARGMDKLAMVVFLADLIEPGRDNKGAVKLRRLVRQDLEIAMLEAIKLNIEYLLESGRYIHPSCIDCWNYLLSGRDRE